MQGYNVDTSEYYFLITTLPVFLSLLSLATALKRDETRLDQPATSLSASELSVNPFSLGLWPVLAGTMPDARCSLFYFGAQW